MTIRDLIAKYGVKIIGEEKTVDVPTVAFQIAGELGKRYIQIDMLPHEAAVAGIRADMERRPVPSSADPEVDEYRLSLVDGIRETFWLDRTEAAQDSPVLIVCGWAHTRFLAEKVRSRSWRVAEEMFFPTSLSKKRIKVLP